MINLNEPGKSNIPVLCVIGHVSIDQVVAPDGTHSSHIGGSAYATAIGAALLSRAVGIVSRVGMDFPTDALLFQRIDHHRIVRVPNGHTSRFYLDYLQADVARGFRGELNVGADISASDIPEDWRTESWIYVATMPPTQQLTILRHLRAHGCLCLSADLLEAYVREDPLLSLEVANTVDILFVNEFEWNSLQLLKCRRSGLTVVKRGSLGAIIYLGENLLVEKSSYNAKVVDPTNAGDVFAGAFLARLLQTNCHEKAIDAALKAGALCVEVRCPETLFEKWQTSNINES